MGEKITLSHGAGGSLMFKLISKAVLENITRKSVKEGVGLDFLDDGGAIPVGNQEIVLSTDGHTVSPIFFPGGDIGRLAIAGTINDVSVMGAQPVVIASAILLEEGFDTDELNTVIKSMDATAQEANVSIITGDTKVMERGALDKVVVTTTGLGIADRGKVITDNGIQPGHQIIVTGTIGDHGIALMAHREGFEFETNLVSDVAPIWETVKAALDVGGIAAMKDPTRGGLASTLTEFAEKSKVGIFVEEEKIPIREEVQAASEMLGINPFEITNEGKAVIAVEPSKTEAALAAIRKTKHGKEAAVIGEATDKHIGRVVLETIVGGRRIIETPIGDPAPRIC